MIDNKAIDVFIGLSLIYLTYSLMATAVQEIIARWVGLRNRMLLKAIRRMLMDEPLSILMDITRDARKKETNTFVQMIQRVTIFGFIYELLLNLIRFFYPYIFDRRSFTKAFFDQPSIAYLGQSSWNSKPAYISAATFSQTLINLLRGANMIPGTNQMSLIQNTLYNTGSQNTIKDSFVIRNETLQMLRNIYVNSAGDLEKFKQNLEVWYNETMDRASGWYKRQTQLILLLIGLFIAYGFNVNSIKIYQILSTDKTARAQMVDLAIRTKDKLKVIYQQQQKGAGGKPLDSIAIERADSVLFNNYNELSKEAAASQKILGLGKVVKPLENSDYLGWLLTAIAISLGANFWFDLLNKFINLRSAGVKPEEDSKSNSADSQLKKVG